MSKTLEEAIIDMYGEEAAQDPSEGWNESKEKLLRLGLKKIHKKMHQIQRDTERIPSESGYLISKRLVNRESSDRTCPRCERYSFDFHDDIYMKKHSCCKKCYILHIEGREQNKEKEVNESQQEFSEAAD